MSALLTSVDGRLITVTLSGKLSRPEYEEVQREAADQIRLLGTVNILVLAVDFAGWDKSDDWGDLSFQIEFDPFIKKIAIVADRKWEDLALAFSGCGVRQPEVAFFATPNLSQARAWLA